MRTVSPWELTPGDIVREVDSIGKMGEHGLEVTRIRCFPTATNGSVWQILARFPNKGGICIYMGAEDKATIE